MPVTVTDTAPPGDVAARPALAPARRALGQAKALLLDWDGCVANGGVVDPAAARLIARWRGAVAIVSNDSAHLPDAIAATLARAGADVPPERIVLAGVEALRVAADRGAARALILGSPALRAYGRRIGLELTREDADLVVLLRDTRFTYARLERAANALRRGARLIVANPDVTHPGRRGAVVPETGALAAALLACVPTIEPLVVGKPEPLLFRRACTALGVSPYEAVMVGDNPDTDLKGAVALGMGSILVGPAGLSLSDLAAD